MEYCLLCSMIELTEIAARNQYALKLIRNFFPGHALYMMGCSTSRASHVTMNGMKAGGSGTKKKEMRGEPDGEEKFGDICKSRGAT